MASFVAPPPSIPSASTISIKIPHINGVRLFLHYGDIADSTNLIKLLYRIQPDEIYHLAAQSHVRVSFDIPEYTGDVTGLGTIRILEAIRETGSKAKFYQASSSEMYGKVQEVPQRETTPFYPRSPYGAAKVYAYWLTVNYRESYGMFACNGILVQPRIAAPGRNLRHAQSHPSRGPHQSRPGEQVVPRQSRRQTRLGLCEGICRSHVADAAARPIPMTTSLRQEKPIRSGTFLKRRFRIWVWTGTIIWKLMSATTVLRKSIC